MRNLWTGLGRVLAQSLQRVRPRRLGQADSFYGALSMVAGLKYASAVTGVCAALLFAAESAFAQTSAQEGYSQPAGGIQQQLGGTERHSDAQDHPSGAKPVATHNTVGLPFTGLDLGLVVAAGVVLLAAGFAIRRLGRSELA